MYHVKLASNFQTVEFDCDNLKDEIVMGGIELINFLGKQIDPKVQPTVKEETEQEDELATEKQLNMLRKLGINPEPTITKKIAWGMIQKITKKK